MKRLPLRPFTAACAVTGTAFVATLVAALGIDAPSDARMPPQALRIEADCRLVDALPLEPLGEEAEETVLAARVRCRVTGGPLRDASAETEWVWAVDRGRLERDAIRWRTDTGTLTTPAGESVVRRDADGRWRTDLQGTIAAADGPIADLAGRRYRLVARLDSPGAGTADLALAALER